jgi:SAM-dependent MidA family methyltransferase
MALVKHTPADERNRILKQVLSSTIELKNLILRPEGLNGCESVTALRLSNESRDLAIRAVAEGDDFSLNEVVALNVEIAEFIDTVKRRLDDDPIETGPEAAAGYWQERAEQAEGILAEINKRVNVFHSLTEATMDEVRTLLIAYYAAKSRD